MGAVHVGISHDDDLMITKFTDIKVIMDSRTKCCDHRLDLRICVNLIESRFFHIQNLSTKRKNGLCRTVTGCFGRSAGRISLDNVNFTVYRIFIRTIGQFSRKRHPLQSRFSSRQISCFSRRFSRALCHHGFFNRHFCNVRILFQENLKL